MFLAATRSCADSHGASEIDDVSAEIERGSEIPPLRDAVAAAREEMNAGRARIREMHDRGLDPLQVCGRLTSLSDGIVSRLFDAAAAEIDPNSVAESRNDLALVGLGGYGRRQMAPYSDIDLMLLRWCGGSPTPCSTPGSSSATVFATRPRLCNWLAAMR